MSNDVRNLTMGELNHVFGGAESCEIPGGSYFEYGRLRRRNLNAGAGGFSAGRAVFDGISYMMLGGAASVALPFLGAGAATSIGITVSAAVLSGGGAALLAIGLTGLVW